MPRPCQRVRLESGIKLDIHRLARGGFIRPGAVTSAVGIGWNDYYGEVIASGLITADMSRTDVGHFRIQLGELDQQIFLVARPRHFGGRQWLFMCPYENRRAAVLWKPPGARYFASRQRWGRRRVAYASQFMTPTDRAHRGQARINSRLCAISGLDPEEWDLPPKPKWMRWRTYNRAVDKFDKYEEVLDEGIVDLMVRFGITI